MKDSVQRRGPSFWNELYWFTALGLVGWMIAAWMLPPRIASTAQLLHRERTLLAQLKALRRREDVLEGAISAMENDPFYIEGVLREQLGVKKPGEKFLEFPDTPSDN